MELFTRLNKFITTNSSMPYYKYIMRIFKDFIFFGESVKVGIPSNDMADARKYFDVENNVNNSINSKYSDSVLSVLKNSTIYDMVLDILDNHNNLIESGKYMYTVYIQINVIIYNIFTNYTDEQIRVFLRSHCYLLEKINRNHKYLSTNNVYVFINQPPEPITSIISKILEHLFNNSILTNSSTLDEMVTVFTSYQNINRLLYISIKIWDVINNKNVRNHRVSSAFSLATIYNDYLSNDWCNYQNYQDIREGLRGNTNIQNVSQLYRIYSEVNNLLETSKDSKKLMELFTIEENLQKEYEDEYMLLVQYNILIDKINNLTNIKQFEKFIFEYCDYIFELYILNKYTQHNVHYYTKNIIASEEDKEKFIMYKLCLIRNVFQSYNAPKNDILNNIIKFLYKKYIEFEKENIDNLKTNTKEPTLIPQNKVIINKTFFDNVKISKEYNTKKPIMDETILDETFFDNSKISKEYNTKKPNYKKDDLLKLAIKMDIIGASRLTVSMLEQSILKQLPGESLEEKAKKLNINTCKLNKSGYTVVILEKLTNTISNVKKTEFIPKTIKALVWDKYIGKEKGIGKCYVCKNNIDSKHFEVGHIKAKSRGGSNTIENLRPICSLCNKSIGVNNMDEFKQLYNL